MAKLSTDELLDAFKELTLIELSEFVKEFEETFGVTAAAPVAIAAALAAAGGGAAAEAAPEEQDEFDVVLEDAGEKKINVIKEVRTLTSLGLKELGDLVDGTPSKVLEKVNKETRGEGQGDPRGRWRHRHAQVTVSAVVISHGGGPSTVGSVLCWDAAVRRPAEPRHAVSAGLRARGQARCGRGGYRNLANRTRWGEDSSIRSRAVHISRCACSLAPGSPVLGAR